MNETTRDISAELFERIVEAWSEVSESGEPAPADLAAALDALDRLCAHEPEAAARFPYALAGSLGLSRLGLVGFALRSSASVREALRRAEQLVALLSVGVSVEREEGDVARWVISREAPERPCMGIVEEATLATWFGLVRELAGSAFAPSWVSASRGFEDVALARAYFGCPVRQEGPCSVMVFDVAALDVECGAADPELSAFLESYARALLSEVGPSEQTTTSRVRRELEGAPEGALPNSSQVARALAMSRRTLYRKLAEEGVTFGEVVDRWREGVATSMLEEGAAEIGEIAYVLGFSEPSAFHRAFRRWTGETPAAWRAART